MATEAGYDGGNVKYRVNGGDFEVIPASAYINNGPSRQALDTAAAGNTNPLAGEQGFTGTDGGFRLRLAGASRRSTCRGWVCAGVTTVECRFDIGRDGCGGGNTTAGTSTTSWSSPAPWPADQDRARP